MRGRFAIRLPVLRIRLFLQFILGVLIISLSVTTSLLSITLFLLREDFSQPWRNLSESTKNGEDGFSCKLHVSKLLQSDESAALNLTNKSLIIVRSVLLLQHDGLYLKILFLKKCETNVSDVRLQIDFKRILCPAVKHIESDECPWDWAPGCAWSSFIASARLDFLNFNSHAIGLRLESSRNIENLLFVLCTQPLYWYIDWLQLIEFIEIWSSQGISHFFFYFYTVSPLVMNILQYYEAKGTVTLLPWRSFPVGENENPNKDVYRLAHSLANNDCLWRSQGAHFVAFVDLDEYILTTSGMPLAAIIEKKAELCPRCGSFTALHRKMYYSSLRPRNDFHWHDISFEWLTNVSYGLAEVDGPHKQIVRPETVSIISTHSTRKSYPGYIDVNLNSSEVILLHASYKWSETNHSMNNLVTVPQLLAGILPSLNSAYREIGQLLFKNETMRIDRMLQMEIAKCINRWHINKCKSVEMCKTEIVRQTRWVHAENVTNDEYQLV
uniref:Glycosyltransferase family 92 protein n=1 Tax=Loa loa TaxID=7209 RepID=A0A1I7VXW5_LOALO